MLQIITYSYYETNASVLNAIFKGLQTAFIKILLRPTVSKNNLQLEMFCWNVHICNAYVLEKNVHKTVCNA